MITDNELNCIIQQKGMQPKDWDGVTYFCTPEILKSLEWKRNHPNPNIKPYNERLKDLESKTNSITTPVEETHINWSEIYTYIFLIIGGVVGIFVAYKIIKLFGKLYIKIERWTEI